MRYNYHYAVNTVK